MREEAAFFQATSTALAGSRTCSDKSREERDFTIQQIVIRTAVSIEFGDTLKAVGMTRTVISVRSDELGEEAPLTAPEEFGSGIVMKDSG